MRTESQETLPIQPVTLVIPVHNEEGAIGQVIREWSAALPAAPGSELLVIDDASTDGTRAIIDGLQKEIPFRLIRNPQSLGYGESLKLGIRQTQTPWIAFTDGDGQYESRDLSVVLRPLQSGYDMTIGIRTPREDPFIRKTISLGFKSLLSVFFVMRAKDPTVALRAGRTDVVRSISEQTRYMKGAFLNEFMARLDRSGFSYAETPVHHYRRPFGRSKNVPSRMLTKTFVQQLIALLRLWKEFHRLEAGAAQPAPVVVEGR